MNFDLDYPDLDLLIVAITIALEKGDGKYSLELRQLRDRLLYKLKKAYEW